MGTLKQHEAHRSRLPFEERPQGSHAKRYHDARPAPPTTTLDSARDRGGTDRPAGTRARVKAADAIEGRLRDADGRAPRSHSNRDGLGDGESARYDFGR